MKQDYFTRDTHKPVEHKKVGSEVRLSGVAQFKKSLKERALQKALSKAKSKKPAEKRYSPEDEEDETEDDRRYNAREGNYDSAKYHAH